MKPSILVVGAAVAGAAWLVGAPARAQAAGGGDAGAGAGVFEDRCSMCHNPKGGGQGPSLEGVVGRRAGALPGFNYTKALKGSGLTWTPANLDRFIAGPTKLVPGTAMKLMLADPRQRKDLISYLASRRGRP